MYVCMGICIITNYAIQHARNIARLIHAVARAEPRGSVVAAGGVPVPFAVSTFAVAAIAPALQLLGSPEVPEVFLRVPVPLSPRSVKGRNGVKFLACAGGSVHVTGTISAEKSVVVW